MVALVAEPSVVQVAVALIAATASLVAAHMARGSKKEAKRAAANTLPVSNGFAADVTTKLDALLGQVGELRGELHTYVDEHNARHDREDTQRRLGR